MVLREALHFLWDPQAPMLALKLRVGAALGLMIGAKLVNIQVPFLFKHAVDGLQAGEASSAAAECGPASAEGAGVLGALLGGLLDPYVLTPAALMLAYGGAKISSDGMTQLRNALFSRIEQGSLRQMSRRTFGHLLQLHLGFHLGRQTGGLSRLVERGTKAVGVLLSTTVLHVVPTAFEVLAVSALLAYHYGASFSLLTLGTLGLYTGFTVGVTRWRTEIRRVQNRAETEASARFTDSLLNYETIKYFDATAIEEARYDAALENYQRAATRTQLSLAALNFGQSLIFSSGLSASLLLAANEVRGIKASNG